MTLTIYYLKTSRIVPSIANGYSHIHTYTQTDSSGKMHTQSHTYRNDKHQIQNYDCFRKERRKKESGTVS